MISERYNQTHSFILKYKENNRLNFLWHQTTTTFLQEIRDHFKIPAVGIWQFLPLQATFVTA